MKSQLQQYADKLRKLTLAAAEAVVLMEDAESAVEKCEQDLRNAKDHYNSSVANSIVIESNILAIKNHMKDLLGDH